MKLWRLAVPAMLALMLSACGGSRLFTSEEGVMTPGSVPRDEMGEPVWDRIKPAPGGTASHD